MGTATIASGDSYISDTSGTVTSVSVVTANGVSGTVATATTTPAITLTLGAINPTSIGATTAGNAQFLSPVNAQTGTTYTIAATDVGKIVTFNNASAITVTLPQQSTTTTSAGFWFEYQIIGAGTVTFVKEGSETLTGNPTAITGSSGIIWRNTTTNWNIFGGTAVTTFSFEKSFPTVVGGDTRYFTVAAPCAGTILDVSQVAGSLGTAGTYTVAISGSNVTGLTTVTNTTTKTTTAATAANTFVYGDTITVAFTSTLTGVNWEGTLRYTRNL